MEGSSVPRRGRWQRTEPQLGAQSPADTTVRSLLGLPNQKLDTRALVRYHRHDVDQPVLPGRREEIPQLQWMTVTMRAI